MKYSEFRKWLKNQGAVFTPAKGSHFRVTLNGRTTIFPDHGSREIGKGLVEQIKKQLGLKECAKPAAEFGSSRVKSNSRIGELKPCCLIP